MDLRVVVVHDGREVQVYPQRREPGNSLQDACLRIGMMVMSKKVSVIIVYRDDLEYRRVTVQEKGSVVNSAETEA